MAKFFKNYDWIDLKIFNEVESKLDENEKFELNLEPKYLAMLYLKHCDFCLNEDDADTNIDTINLNFGYQTCDNCKKRNIGNTYVKKWMYDQKYLPLKFFDDSEKIFNSKDNFRIQRTSGAFENNWFIDVFGHLQYTIREDETEDVLIPMYKASSNTEVRERGCNKDVYLSELCRFNNLSETETMNLFREKFNKFYDI